MTLTDVSIDDNGDDDFLKFTTRTNADVTITLSPAGSTYLAGPQNQNGSCSAGSSFNAAAESNLSFQLIGTNGTTVISSVNETVAGVNEILLDEPLSDGPGTYYIKIEGAQNAAQLYDITLSIDNADVPGCTDQFANNYDPEATKDDGSCTFDCTGATTIIDNSNVNSVIISSANNLETQGTISASANSLFWQADQSIELNANFHVVLGAELTIDAGDCN